MLVERSELPDRASCRTTVLTIHLDLRAEIPRLQAWGGKRVLRCVEESIYALERGPGAPPILPYLTRWDIGTSPHWNMCLIGLFTEKPAFAITGYDTRGGNLGPHQWEALFFLTS
jgi:hypothetical protein